MDHRHARDQLLPDVEVRGAIADAEAMVAVAQRRGRDRRRDATNPRGIGDDDRIVVLGFLGLHILADHGAIRARDRGRHAFGEGFGGGERRAEHESETEQERGLFHQSWLQRAITWRFEANEGEAGRGILAQAAREVVRGRSGVCQRDVRAEVRSGHAGPVTQTASLPIEVERESKGREIADARPEDFHLRQL